MTMNKKNILITVLIAVAVVLSAVCAVAEMDSPPGSRNSGVSGAADRRTDA